MRYRAFFIFLLLFDQAFCQSTEYFNYTIKDGLPSDMVYCAVQDDQGFMWFGTDAGLSRFDGHEFVNYSLEDGLPDHEIINFFKDSWGRIWLYTINGKAGYLQNGKIHTAQNTEFLKQLDQERLINSIFEHDSTIYFSGAPQLRALSGKDVKFIEIGADKKFSYALPLKDVVLVFTNSNIVVVNNEIQSLKSWKKSFDQFKPGLLPFPYHHFIRDGKVFFAMLNEEFIGEFDLSNNHLMFHKVESVIYNLVQLGETSLVLTENGVYNFDEYSTSLGVKRFDIPRTSNIYEDNNQNVWITSLSGGVFMKKTSVVQSIKEIQAPGKLQKAGDKLYVQEGQHRVLQMDSLGKVSEFKSFEIEDVRNIYTLQSKPLVQTSHTIFIGDSQISARYCRALAIQDSMILALRRNIIYKLEESTLFEDSVLQKEIVRGRDYEFRNAMILNKDSVYIATENGLLFFDGNSVDRSEGILSDLNIRMNDIESYLGYLTMGTYRDGVILTNGDTTLHLNTEVGLNSNVVTSLFVHDSILWVGTKSGLNRVELIGDKLDIITITSEDGLQEGQVIDIVFYNNNLYVSTSEGLSYFDVAESFEEKNTMPLLINEVYADNKLIADTTDHTFPSETDDFMISYTAVLFGNKKSLRFRHQLKPIGDYPDNWRETSSRQTYYSNQKPGSYVFQLQCKTKNSHWSELKEIPITIMIPFWQTWWFQFLAVILLVSVSLFIFFRVRLNRDIKEKLDRDRVQAEIKALKAQINPHFLFNALSSIQRFIIKDEKGMAEDYLADYGQLIRKVLDHSNELTVTLKEELDTLKLYAEIEQLRTDHQFDATFEIHEEIDQYITYIPSMIIQPLLENSIWHGIRPLKRKGQIDVKFDLIGADQIRVTLQDNGVGFEIGDYSESHKSLGSKLVVERMNLLRRYYNKDFGFQIDSRPGEGTVAVITFPADL